MKKIAIIGATIIGNRGAEAMLSTTVARTKEQYPNSEFYIYSYYPKEDQKLLKEHKDIVVYSSTPLYLVTILFPFSFIVFILKLLRFNILIKFLPKSVQKLSESDVLIDLAGVSFMDGREMFLPFNVLTIFPAMLVGTPVVKFAQGLGSFNNTITRITSKLFLSKCKQVFARGDKSLSYLKTLLPNNDNYQISSDVAFLFKNGDSLSMENIEYCNKLKLQLEIMKDTNYTIIGICPSSVVYKKSLKENIDYIDLLVNNIEEILNNENMSVFIFPNTTKELYPDILRNNDLPIIKQVIEKLEQRGVSTNNIVSVSKDINTDGIKMLLNYCDISIVSRFHAMIASLSLSKPVIVLGWSHKYLEVMKQFNMEKWVLDYKQSEQLIQYINEIILLKDSISKEISQKLPQVNKESFKQFEYIFKNI